MIYNESIDFLIRLFEIVNRKFLEIFFNHKAFSEIIYLLLKKKYALSLLMHLFLLKTKHRENETN